MTSSREPPEARDYQHCQSRVASRLAREETSSSVLPKDVNS